MCTCECEQEMRRRWPPAAGPRACAMLPSHASPKECKAGEGMSGYERAARMPAAPGTHAGARVDGGWAVGCEVVGGGCTFFFADTKAMSFSVAFVSSYARSSMFGMAQ